MSFAADPATAVATVLAAAGLGLVLPAGATPGNLFTSSPLPPNLPAIPHAAVFVEAYGGVAPRPVFSNGKDFQRPKVQVKVRGDVNEPAAARTLARGIIAALHKQAVSPYTGCVALQSEPVPLGVDATGHAGFSVNVELWYVG